MKQSVSNYDFLSFVILLKYMQINVPLYKTRLFVYDFIYVQTFWKHATKTCKIKHESLYFTQPSVLNNNLTYKLD